MRCVFAQRRYSTSDKHKIQVLLYRYDDRTGRRIRRNTRRILVVLHGFKSKGSKTRSVDSKFAAPYIGSWPFVISRLATIRSRSGQSRHQAVGSTDWISRK